MGKEISHELNNSTHSAEARFHVPRAKQILAEEKEYENKFVTKMIPTKDGKGYIVKKIKLKKEFQNEGKRKSKKRKANKRS